MSSDKDQQSAPRSSDGSAPGAVAGEQQACTSLPFSEWLGGEAITPEEASDRTGLPVSFFNNTWRDDPDYIAKYVTPYEKTSETV